MVNGCVRLASPANILAAIFVWQGSREYSDRYFRLGSPANILAVMFVWRVSREYSGRYIRLASLPRISTLLCSPGNNPVVRHIRFSTYSLDAKLSYITRRKKVYQ